VNGLDEVKGAPLRFVEYSADILAENAEDHQLNPSKKRQGHD
jgi:hypothetical protein